MRYIDEVEKIYIIDNTPNKNNEDIIKNKDNKVIYIANNENLGMAKTLNMAAELALNDGYKYDCIINSVGGFTPMLFIIQQKN